MPSEDAGKSETFGSAAHLMIEALDKASQELEQTVNTCLKQVNEYSATLEKQLINRLQKVVDLSGSVLDTQLDELSNRREEFVERLAEFERTEIETLTNTAKEVRQQITAKAQQATDSIERLVEEQMAELRTLIDNPQAFFTEYTDARLEAVRDIAKSTKERIEQHETALERKISERSEEFDKAIQEVCDGGKKEVDVRMETHNANFEQKIQGVLNKLTEIVNLAAAELKQSAIEGTKTIQECSAGARERLGQQYNDWSKDVEEINSHFQSSLGNDRAVQEDVHRQKLDRKSQEVREEIEHIAQDATTKITASHKLFYNSLKRLEKKYFDRLDRLFTRFESALAQESNLSSGSKMQSTSELRMILSSRLQSRGEEVIKSFQRNVEQIETEYVRSSQGYHERVESIKTMTIESLERQMRVMAQEIERITRNFNNGLADLNLELPQIEERGRAAALAVKAYRSMMLSIDGDDDT